MTNDINRSVEELLTSRIKGDQAALVGKMNDFLQRIAPDSPVRVQRIDSVPKCSNISTVLTDFKWDDKASSPIDKAETTVLYQQIYDNRKGADKMTPTFSFSKSTQDSHTFKFTEGLKVGAKTSVSAGLDFLAKGEVTISAEVSFSAEQSFSYADTKTWTMSVPVEVLPGTVANVKGSLRISKKRGQFEAVQRVTDGLAQVWVTNTMGMKMPGIYPLSVLLDPQDRDFKVSGSTESATGVSCTLVQTQEPE